MYMKIRTQVPQPGFRSSIYGLLFYAPDCGGFWHFLEGIQWGCIGMDIQRPSGPPVIQH